MKKLILLLWFFLLWTPNIQAEMYSWTDEKGVRHYSNTGVPPGQNAIDVQREIERINRGEAENDEALSSASPESGNFKAIRSSGDYGQTYVKVVFTHSVRYRVTGGVYGSGTGYENRIKKTEELYDDPGGIDARLERTPNGREFIFVKAKKKRKRRVFNFAVPTGRTLQPGHYDSGFAMGYKAFSSTIYRDDQLDFKGSFAVRKIDYSKNGVNRLASDFSGYSAQGSIRYRSEN